MSSIGVVIYSYKGKLLKETVRQINENLSGSHTVNVYIIDQSPIIKNNYYDNIKNVEYKHKFWDHPYGQCHYRFEIARNVKEDFTLIISDNIFLSKKWDSILIENYKDNSVISGKGIPNITNDNFFIYNNSVESNNFSLSQIVNKDFIFLKTELFKNTNYPTFLKYKGEAEYLSFYWFTRGVDIYSCPTDFYSVEGFNSIDTVYVPYSLTHNYNEIIKIINNEPSKYFDPGSKRSVLNFIDHHNINKDSIYPLPFLTNDVEYDCYNNPFDKLDGRKFIGRLHYIY